MNATSLWEATETEGGILLPDENKWRMIRGRRDELLAKSDWTQLPDAVLSLNEKQAWSAYRQALRDLPENFSVPNDVIFPDVPGGEQ